MINNIYHQTHINNLESILKWGLSSLKAIKENNITVPELLYRDCPKLRDNLLPKAEAAPAWDEFIPFYFFKRNPHLDFVLKGKIYDQKDTIFIEVPLSSVKLSNGFFVIGDRKNPETIRHDEGCVKALSYITNEQIKNWKPYMKRLEAQELLEDLSSTAYIKNNVVTSEIVSIITYDALTANKVSQIVSALGITNISIKVGTEVDYFFTNSAIHYEEIWGPNHIFKMYSAFVNMMHDKYKPNKNAHFKDIEALKRSLDASMHNLKETSELVDLQTFNKVHKEDVGNHTLSVVKYCKDSSEYSSLNEHYKVIVELSAYLHDIGKGPKSRWANTNGLQLIDPNHPLKSMYMLERIILEELQFISHEDMELLIKVICYHDLIGDIASKGRRIDELKGVIKNELEYTVLLALSKGDIYSINPDWVHLNNDFFNYLKTLI